MSYPVYFNPKKSLKLFNHSNNFVLLKNLYIQKKLPKVLMLTGTKGLGKSTLINHLMFYIFDKENYNTNTNEFNENSNFYNQFLNDINENIIYLSGSDFKNISIEDIRNLKKKIFQTTIADIPRYIIFDDVELFNNNSLNALLKIIEEPGKNNYFFLINNKSKFLLDTIKSRCLEIKIFLNEQKRIDIINKLIENFKIESKINYESFKLSPGQFVKFNYILNEHEITLDADYLKNLRILLNLYKKNKETILIEMTLFITDYYFNILKSNGSFSNNKIIEYKDFVFENINKFFTYNLNQNTLLSSINSKINNE